MYLLILACLSFSQTMSSPLIGLITAILAKYLGLYYGCIFLLSAKLQNLLPVSLQSQCMPNAMQMQMSSYF